MAQELETNNELLNFDWEKDTEDFFGTTKTTEPTKTTPTKVDPPKKDDTPEPGKKPEEEEQEEEDFFELEETDENGTVKTTNSSTEETGYKETYRELREIGVFKHVEVPEDEEIDLERLVELHEEEYEAEVTERLSNWATKDLDEDAKAFIKFKRDGGSTADFFKAYSKSSDLPTGSIEDESYQDAVIRYQLAQEGWDKDEIEDRLEYLTDSGKKEKIAKKYDEKVKEQVNKEKAAILKSQEESKRIAKANEEEFKVSVKEALEEVSEVSGIKITAQDKNTLFNFLTKRDQKVSDTKSITGFQKKLADVFQDTEKMILLAKMIQSDFDLSSLEKTITTKKTREIKKDLEQRKGLRPTGSGSSSGSNLADLFN